MTLRGEIFLNLLYIAEEAIPWVPEKSDKKWVKGGFSGRHPETLLRETYFLGSKYNLSISSGS